MTPKQEKFCFEYIRTGNKSEAYRRAYNAENMKAETVNNSAYKLFQNDDITTRIKELQDKLANSRSITLESQLEELNNLKILSKKAEKYNDAINALKEQNKLLALYKEHNQQKEKIWVFKEDPLSETNDKNNSSKED